MRNLKRWTNEFIYQPYVGKTEIMKDGKHTGKFQVSYGSDVQYSGTFSAPNGQAAKELFGIDISYTHVLIMDNPNADIKEDGLIHWKNNVYEVKAVRPSMNILTVALKRMVSNG